MKLRGIPIKGYRIKDGKPVKAQARKDASARIRERTSKKVKVVKRTP